MFLSYIKKCNQEYRKGGEGMWEKVNIQQTYIGGSFLMTVSQSTRNLALTHINIINLSRYR